MTSRETIRMFARLKGVPEKYINNLINELGQVLKFSEHMDKWTCDLRYGDTNFLSEKKYLHCFLQWRQQT